MKNTVLDDLLTYPKLIARIEKSDNPKEAKKKVIANFHEMKADYSPSYLKTVSKFFDASLPRLYDGINFNENGTDLKELLKSSSVVLVPNHQSHADYIAINYRFYKEYKRMLYVAGGDNLNIFPIGKIFRKSGCFFIRRSFANDILYKFTMEAYLYALLKRKEPIEFFFEGGRTRSGKLRAPKYGLYQMLLEAHSHLEDAEQRGLTFIPVSIAHEYVPEQKALAKEMMGGKKVKESTGQLFGLLKLVAYQFGKIHINLGKPIQAHKLEDADENKVNVQNLAFKCFRRVGDQMVMTPTNLLVLILLDETSGALQWSDILLRAKAILEYCHTYDVPLTEGLQDSVMEDSLGRAIDILIGNDKVEVIGSADNKNKFYSIKKESRGELLFFKNTILHHFIVPWTISLAWIHVFSGEISCVDTLKEFFSKQRDQLKHEFYLPTIKQYYSKTLKILSNIVGRDVQTLKDVMNFSNKDMYEVASRVGIFSRALTYINEGYFVAALTFESFTKDNVKTFKQSEYMKRFSNVFEAEIQTQRVIRFPESNNVELMKTSLKYFEQSGILDYADNAYFIADQKKLDEYIKNNEKVLKDQLKFNFKVI